MRDMVKSVLGGLAKVGAATLAAVLVVPLWAGIAGAQTVDSGECEVFYPERCVDPATGGIDIGLFNGDTAGYAAALGSLARQQAGDDGDGNGIPDSPEIAVCGAAGCLPEWVDNQTPTETQRIVTTCCDSDGRGDPLNTYTLKIPNGFNALKGFAVIDRSETIVHYSGPYPRTGEVTLRFDPPAISQGVHRLVAIGTDANSAKPKVVIWRHDVLPEPKPSVAGSAQRPASTGGSTLVRTGSEAVRWVSVGGALLLLGSALVFGVARSRRNRRAD